MNEHIVRDIFELKKVLYEIDIEQLRREIIYLFTIILTKIGYKYSLEIHDLLAFNDISLLVNSIKYEIDKIEYLLNNNISDDERKKMKEQLEELKSALDYLNGYLKKEGKL